MDVIRSLRRHNAIGYHLAEAEAWLEASNRGEHTTLLSYAAFELRLEIERLAVELLDRIRGGLTPEDERTIREFGRIENRIYELEGHQRILDRKIALANIMLDELKVGWRLKPINVGQLRHGWHECSAFCHITWSLSSSTPGSKEASSAAFDTLSDIQRVLRAIVDGGISWPRIADPSFVELQNRFLAGEASDDEIVDWLRNRGLWAQVVRPDGTTDFVGVPIPPPAG